MITVSFGGDDLPPGLWAQWCLSGGWVLCTRCAVPWGRGGVPPANFLSPFDSSWWILLWRNNRARGKDIRRAVDVCAASLRQAMESNMVSHSAVTSACVEGKIGHSMSTRTCCDTL